MGKHQINIHQLLLDSMIIDCVKQATGRYLRTMSCGVEPTPVHLLASYLCGSKLEISLSPLHVDGVVAREFIFSNDIIFAERPLCFQQTLPNSQDVIICGECQTVLEPLEIQVGILSKSMSRECIVNRADVCQCRAKCGVLYCSGEVPAYM